MGGRETVTEIRKIHSDAVVIAVSGYSDDPVMADPQTSGSMQVFPSRSEKNAC